MLLLRSWKENGQGEPNMDPCALFTHNNDGNHRSPSSLTKSVSQPDTAASLGVWISTLTQSAFDKGRKQARGYLLVGN